MTTKKKTRRKKNYADKVKLHRLLSQIIEKVEGDRDGAIIDRIEKSLTRFNVRIWNKTATKANNQAVRAGTRGSQTSKFTDRDLQKVLRALDKNFNTIEDRVRPRIKRDTEKIYKTNKKRFIPLAELREPEVDEEREKILRKAEGPLLALSFGVEDAFIMDNLTRLHAVSIGNHFEKNLRPQLAKTIGEGVIDKGLNKAQAGKFLEKELTRKLGGRAFGAVPAKIRAQGQDSVNAYFKGLSATNVNFARNFGQIQAMTEAGVDRYVISAVLDAVTSVICEQMDGREFSIEAGRKAMLQVLEAEDSEGLQQVAPWRKDLKEFDLGAGQKLTSSSSAKTLADAGLALPPYHFRCRSDVFPA